jgi:hypothetical protein
VLRKTVAPRLGWGNKGSISCHNSSLTNGRNWGYYDLRNSIGVINSHRPVIILRENKKDGFYRLNVSQTEVSKYRRLWLWDDELLEVGILKKAMMTEVRH